MLLGKALIDNRDLFAVPAGELEQMVEGYLVPARMVSVRDSLIPTLLATFMQLARLQAWRGDEDMAVKQLECHLDVWVLKAGPNFCGGCMQRRDAGTPTLVCAECRVARSFFLLLVWTW